MCSFLSPPSQRILLEEQATILELTCEFISLLLHVPISWDVQKVHVFETWKLYNQQVGRPYSLRMSVGSNGWQLEV